MLAWDDAGLARLIRAAQAVPYRERAHWLQQLAHKLEPPRRNTREVRAHRERARNGIRKIIVGIGPDDEEHRTYVGVVREWDLEDRKQIGAAIERLMALLRAEHAR